MRRPKTAVRTNGFCDFVHAANHGVDDDEEGDSEDDEDENEDEDEGFGDRYMKETVEKKIWGTSAAEKPAYKWKMIWDAWKQMCELRVQEDYYDPDNSELHVYTDFNGYGIVALLEIQGSPCPARSRRHSDNVPFVDVR